MAVLKEEARTAPLMSRAATLPKSIDNETRTVELVWSTGEKVQRRGIFSDRVWEEELDMADGAIDLSRLQSGAPLLNSHNQYDLGSQIGVVESAEVKKSGGKRTGVAVVRFSTRAEVDPIWNDVKDGIIRNVSVGYTVQEWERIEKDGQPIRMIARKWTPIEVSLVAVPADAASQIRSQDAGQAEFPCLVRYTEQEDTMALENQNTRGENTPKPDGEKQDKPADQADPRQTGSSPTGATTGASSVPPDPAPQTTQDPNAGSVRSGPGVSAPQPTGNSVDVAAMERARIQGIARAAELMGLRYEDQAVQALIANGTSLDGEQGARAQIMALGVQRRAAAPAPQTRGQISTPVGGQDEQEVTHRAMSYALSIRGGIRLSDEERQDVAFAQANEFRGMSLLDMARDSLTARGVRVRGMSKTEVAQQALAPVGRESLYSRAAIGGMHSTSDFVTALNGAVRRTLRAAYAERPQTFREWVGQRTVPDFKAVNELMLSDGPALLPVGEHGEFKRGTWTDAGMSYKIETFGRVVAVTRQVIVNDDIGMINRIPALFGRAARDLEENVVYSLLLSNPVMWDGTPLFHANHGNLAGSGGAITVENLAVARTAMANQKGIDGKTPAPVTPRTMLVPPSKELVTEQLLGQFLPNATTGVVPNFVRSLRVLTVPLIEQGAVVGDVTQAGSATAWYLLGDAAGVDTLVSLALEGEEGLFTDTRVGFDIDGVEYKVREDFGAAVLDWRGLYKNPGA
jgi:phage head maturation protease